MLPATRSRAAAPVAVRLAGAGAFVRRHWLVGALLLAGLALRVLTWLAYQPAILYTDSFYYLDNVGRLDPQFLDPIGYPLFVLKGLLPLGGLRLVTVVQHLAGLGMAVLLYRIALRCRARRWLAALATAPVLLDGYQLQIEQNILSDVWLEVLLVAALWLLVGRGAPGWRRAAVAGLVLALALTVRMVAIVAVVPAVAYLVIVGRAWRLPGGWRRIGARVGALGLAFGAVVFCYAGYFHLKAGYWGLSTASGNSIYGRTAVVADCPRLGLDRVLAELCPAEPLGARLSSDNYAHLDVDPNWPGYVPPGETKYDLDRQFAARVIERQPFDVLGAALTDFAKGFAWRHTTLPGDPPAENWQFQTSYPVFALYPLQPVDQASRGAHDTAVAYGGVAPSVNTGLAAFLRGYQLGWGYTPGPALAAFGILGLLGGFGVGRARRSGLRAACLLASGLALTVLGTAAAFEFSWRYQLPGLVLLPLAGALGVTALTAARPD